LGVTDHRFLGVRGRWRDSGMMGVASNDRPGAFWRADLDEAAGELVRIIREVRPQVLVTYDENGFYGHPDHIQANRVSARALELAADPAFGEGEPWRIAKFYVTAVARSTMRRTAQALGEAGTRFLPEQVEDLPYGCADEDVTTEIDARAHIDAKIAAMRAHATQISVETPWYALSNDVGQEVLAVEHYILRSGVPGPSAPAAPVEVGGLGEPYKVEDDLFAGID
ncbi:N-acetyl-1-D-myo-inositol-2-amino-2-deoxy-alpha-D-glucopyranoside deacetylase, partial [Streptosporangium algeriense]